MLILAEGTPSVRCDFCEKMQGVHCADKVHSHSRVWSCGIKHSRAERAEFFFSGRTSRALKGGHQTWSTEVQRATASMAISPFSEGVRGEGGGCESHARNREIKCRDRSTRYAKCNTYTRSLPLPPLPLKAHGDREVEN